MAVENNHSYSINRNYIHNMKKFSVKQMLWDKMVIKAIKGVINLIKKFFALFK